MEIQRAVIVPRMISAKRAGRIAAIRNVLRTASSSYAGPGTFGVGGERFVRPEAGILRIVGCGWRPRRSLVRPVTGDAAISMRMRLRSIGSALLRFPHASLLESREQGAFRSTSGGSTVLANSSRVYTANLVTGRFRNLVRATAWLFLAWTAVDLGVPSLCALDHEPERPRIYSSSALMDARSSNETSPDAPVHVDDCFCCSHCVNVTPMHCPEILTIARTDTALPSDSAPVAAGYPPYHPPRA